MNLNDKIFIAGHRGLVGSAIMRALKKEGYKNIITRTRSELDLTNQLQVNNFISKERPSYIFLAAAKVGGIHANNTFRGDFIYQNLSIQMNLMEAARHNGIKRLLFLGSSCIYPRACPQPIKEEYLLQSALEPTNEPYAIAKIAGIKICEAFNIQYGTEYASVMPTNLYGPGDNFNLETSHVIPALMRKAHEAKVNNAKSMTIWGSGKPMREFLHVDDMADACVFVMKKEGFTDILNIGTGIEISIKSVAELICKVVGFTGALEFDSSKPDGTMRKLVDTAKINALGWKAKIHLEEGLKNTYQWYLSNYANLAEVDKQTESVSH